MSRIIPLIDISNACREVPKNQRTLLMRTIEEINAQRPDLSIQQVIYAALDRVQLSGAVGYIDEDGRFRTNPRKTRKNPMGPVDSQCSCGAMYSSSDGDAGYVISAFEPGESRPSWAGDVSGDFYCPACTAKALWCENCGDLFFGETCPGCGASGEPQTRENPRAPKGALTGLNIFVLHEHFHPHGQLYCGPVCAAFDAPSIPHLKRAIAAGWIEMAVPGKPKEGWKLTPEGEAGVQQFDDARQKHRKNPISPRGAGGKRRKNPAPGEGRGVASLLSHPVMFDASTGTFDRANPIPARAKALRKGEGKRDVPAATRSSGIGRVDWGRVLEHIEEYQTASVAERPTTAVIQFVEHFRLGKNVSTATQIGDCFIAGNAKTKKPRPSGRLGAIGGLALFPHFYPNLLDVVPDQFLDENDVIDVPQLTTEDPGFAQQSELGEELRTFFNSFDGTTKKHVEEFTGIAPRDQLDFCAGASEFCRSTCLVLSGNNPASTPAVAKKANLTRALLTNPELFVASLWIGIDAIANNLRKPRKGYKKKDGGVVPPKPAMDCVIRLNMLSDIPWYAVCPELLTSLADPARGDARVYWYDYTKLQFWKSAEYRALTIRDAKGNVLLKPSDVLDLTFSFSGSDGNAEACREALDVRDAELGYPNGVRIAVAFAPANPDRPSTVAQRTTWDEIVASGMVTRGGSRRGDPRYFIDLDGWGPREIVDGDGSDYRIDDPGGCIVALNFKQPAVSDESVPGIKRRIRESREVFAKHVPETEGFPRPLLKGEEKLLEQLEAGEITQEEFDEKVAKLAAKAARKNPLPVLGQDAGQELTGDAPDALASGELRFPMFQVGDLLIGPHVPTVLAD